MTLIDQFEAYSRQRQVFMTTMHTLSQDELTARPIAGGWTILEVFEHLALAEREVLAGLPPYDLLRDRPRSWKHQIRFWLVIAVLKYGIPVKVPSQAMVPSGTLSFEEISRQWDRNEEWLRAYLRDQDEPRLRRAVFSHPVAGPTTPAQTVRMAQAHLRTHVRQIKRILARLR